MPDILKIADNADMIVNCHKQKLIIIKYKERINLRKTPIIFR